MYRKLALTAVLAAGLATAPGADAAVNKCKVRGSTTLAASGQSRAYAKNGAVIACLKRTGVRRALDGVEAGTDVVKVAGKFVAFSSASDMDESVRSLVNVQRIADGAIPQFMPTDTGGQVANIVVKPNGAAAWAVSPLDDPEMTYVQGNERSNHSPQLFSDNELGGVDASTLHSDAGSHISWLYADGTSGDADLFTGPANLF